QDGPLLRGLRAAPPRLIHAHEHADEHVNGEPIGAPGGTFPPMRLRPLVASLGLTALAATACSSSSPYGTPKNAAIGTGLAVAAAGANRAVTGECWAACRPGTVCDHATGLCVEPGHRSPSGGGSHPSSSPVAHSQS